MQYYPIPKSGFMDHQLAKPQRQNSYTCGQKTMYHIWPVTLHHFLRLWEETTLEEMELESLKFREVLLHRTLVNSLGPARFSNCSCSSGQRARETACAAPQAAVYHVIIHYITVNFARQKPKNWYVNIEYFDWTGRVRRRGSDKNGKCGRF